MIRTAKDELSLLTLEVTPDGPKGYAICLVCGEGWLVQKGFRTKRDARKALKMWRARFALDQRRWGSDIIQQILSRFEVWL